MRLYDEEATRLAFSPVVGEELSGVYTVLAFVGGSTWQQYGTRSLAERRQAVLEGFAAMFGEKALHPIEYTEHDWTRERWTGGGPTAIYPPGVMSTHGRHLRERFRHVHWAGTETATAQAMSVRGGHLRSHRPARMSPGMSPAT